MNERLYKLCKEPSHLSSVRYLLHSLDEVQMQKLLIEIVEVNPYLAVETYFSAEENKVFYKRLTQEIEKTLCSDLQKSVCLLAAMSITRGIANDILHSMLLIDERQWMELDEHWMNLLLSTVTNNIVDCKYVNEVYEKIALRKGDYESNYCNIRDMCVAFIRSQNYEEVGKVIKNTCMYGILNEIEDGKFSLVLRMIKSYVRGEIEFKENTLFLFKLLVIKLFLSNNKRVKIKVMEFVEFFCEELDCLWNIIDTISKADKYELGPLARKREYWHKKYNLIGVPIYQYCTIIDKVWLKFNCGHVVKINPRRFLGASSCRCLICDGNRNQHTEKSSFEINERDLCLKRKTLKKDYFAFFVKRNENIINVNGIDYMPCTIYSLRSRRLELLYETFTTSDNLCKVIEKYIKYINSVNKINYIVLDSFFYNVAQASITKSEILIWDEFEEGAKETKNKKKKNKKFYNLDDTQKIRECLRHIKCIEEQVKDTFLVGENNLYSALAKEAKSIEIAIKRNSLL